jgi:hypothetical protein
MTRASLLFLSALAVIVFAVTLAGCADTKDVTATEVEVLVGLQRTACYGRCPVYELSVLNTGEATLNVGRFCEEAFGRSLEMGTHRANVDVGLWRMVADLAYDMGYDTLQTRYDDPMVMDLPANIVTVNGKTVFSRYGGPDLNDLYMRIERLIGTTDWKADPSTAR